jgi:hypothetical protein
VPGWRPSRDVAKRKKMGGCKRNFFKTLGCIEKFFGHKGDIYKIFKSWRVQNLIFPSDDLFLNKNTDFCWEIAKICKSLERSLTLTYLSICSYKYF